MCGRSRTPLPIGLVFGALFCAGNKFARCSLDCRACAIVLPMGDQCFPLVLRCDFLQSYTDVDNLGRIAE